MIHITIMSWCVIFIHGVRYLREDFMKIKIFFLGILFSIILFTVSLFGFSFSLLNNEYAYAATNLASPFNPEEYAAQNGYDYSAISDWSKWENKQKTRTMEYVFLAGYVGENLISEAYIEHVKYNTSTLAFVIRTSTEEQYQEQFGLDLSIALGNFTGTAGFDIITGCTNTTGIADLAATTLTFEDSGTYRVRVFAKIRKCIYLRTEETRDVDKHGNLKKWGTTKTLERKVFYNNDLSDLKKEAYQKVVLS